MDAHQLGGPLVQCCVLACALVSVAHLQQLIDLQSRERRRSVFVVAHHCTSCWGTEVHTRRVECSLPYLVDVPRNPVVQNERHQQRFHVLLWDVEALGNEGDAHARVGLDELEQDL